LALAAERICNATGAVTWGIWLSEFCVRAEIFPPAAVSDRLAALRLRHSELSEPIERLLAYCRGVDGSPEREDREAIVRLTRDHRGAGDRNLQLATPKPN
jgi:hypothetical protein